ncbi:MULTISPECIES: hypothetical protein [Pseudomonas]|uniref:hypothetical protein n=1 Tax=Pseudomonas TaxID=286 RepID=UPI001FD7543C|nr:MULTISPECIES: hypothetical protein [unclassified Pseudomonas]
MVRDANKAGYWAELGCQVTLAHMGGAQSLTEAFKGAMGVFILLPSGAGLSCCAHKAPDMRYRVCA